MGQLKKLVPRRTRTAIVERANRFLPEGTIRRTQFANAISVGGAVLVETGVRLDRAGYKKTGLAVRAVGHAADDFDGDWARALDTAGRSGERVDATLDKGKVARELAVLWKNSEKLAPRERQIRRAKIIAIASKHIVNGGLNLYIESTGTKAHSSLAGKANMWADGITFVAWGISDIAESDTVGDTAERIGDTTFIIGLGLGVVASTGYAVQAIRASRGDGAIAEVAEPTVEEITDPWINAAFNGGLWPDEEPPLQPPVVE